jgi:chromosome segregation ATPase
MIEYREDGGNPMDKEELEWLVDRVESLVNDLKSTRGKNKELLSEKRRLQQKLVSLEKRYGQVEKEGGRVKDLMSQNKAYEKKCALLKHKITSMLAKVEALQ